MCALVVLGNVKVMAVKIKIVSSREYKVEVKIKRPNWQQFIKY